MAREFSCTHGENDRLPHGVSSGSGSGERCPSCGRLRQEHRSRLSENPAIPPRPAPGQDHGVYELAGPLPSPPRTGKPSPRPAARVPSPSPPRPVLKLLRESLLGAGKLQELSLCLIVLSVADIFITFALLSSSRAFYESNPIAQWFFARWNMAGMVVFKFASIGLAIALGEIIERRRPGWGKLVLVVGCMAAAVVVWHGLRLALGVRGIPLGGGN